MALCSVILLSLLGWAAVFALYDNTNGDDDSTDADDPDLDEPETVTGTTGDDFLIAQDNQVVGAGEGDDRIRVQGDATVYGGQGNDVLRSHEGAGEVSLYGNEGDDLIDTLATRNSSIFVGLGDDRIHAGHDALVRGGGGPDIISAGDNGLVFGGAGDDTMSSAYSNTYLLAQDGDDTVELSGDNVIALLGDGNDTATSVGTQVTMYGGEGEDTLTLGLGNTALTDEFDDVVLNLRVEDIGNGRAWASAENNAVVINVPTDWSGGTDVTVTEHLYLQSDVELYSYTIQIGDHEVLQNLRPAPTNAAYNVRYVDSYVISTLPDGITVNVV